MASNYFSANEYVNWMMSGKDTIENINMTASASGMLVYEPPTTQQVLAANIKPSPPTLRLRQTSTAQSNRKDVDGKSDRKSTVGVDTSSEMHQDQDALEKNTSSAESQEKEEKSALVRIAKCPSRFTQQKSTGEMGDHLEQQLTRATPNVIVNADEYEKLKQWCDHYGPDSSNYDASNPDTIALLSKLREYQAEEEQLKRGAAINVDAVTQRGRTRREHDDRLVFCSMDEALENPRIKLLQLRHQGLPGLKQQMVPLNERKASMALFDLDQGGVDGGGGHGGGQENKKTRDVRREKGLKILRKVRMQLFHQSQEQGFERPRTLDDLVHEDTSVGL